MRIAAGALILAASASAHADVPRCATGDATVTFDATDLQEMDGDTGWFPSGYAAQLRLTGRVTGQTTVAMGLAPTACWDDTAMTATAPGQMQAGLLDSQYGAELHLFGQIHTSILGQSIDWSGEIPVPFVPTDLLIAGTTTFDPVLLPDSPQSSVSVSDTTSPVTVISTNLLADIIDITGISGGLAVQVQGQMATSYGTTAISLGDGTIASTSEHVAVATPAGGFGPMLTLPVAAAGVVHYAPSLIFAVVFQVKILGIRVVDYQLASVTMPLPGIDRPIALAGDPATLPLPHLSSVPASLGFAGGATQTLKLHNDGAAPLVLELASAPAGVSAGGTTIAPGADAEIAVAAADPSAVSGALVLATNDPNHGTLTIALDAASQGQTDDPQPGEHAGGCSTGRGAPTLLLALMIPAIRRRRRRR